MRILYNVILFILLILAGPLLLVKAVITPKYRGRILGRLGFGFQALVGSRVGGPRIWIHALSLGEVASCQALVRAIRVSFPDAMLFFSSATTSGETFARRNLAGPIDSFIPFPFDFPCVVRRVVSCVRPDLFVLVETDFWPNFLFSMQRRGVPTLLVNGRISDKSWHWYQRARWFFSSLFSSFRFLALQSELDVERMMALGMASERVGALGNLKFAVEQASPADSPAMSLAELGISLGSRVVVAGSTHDGEEEMLFQAAQPLFRRYPELVLVVAPREVARGEAVEKLAAGRGFVACRRTGVAKDNCQVLVLDTLGELSRVYGIADIAYVGGSLVPERGHNPLEPVGFGKPVLYGPSMEDFVDVSSLLLRAGAAKQLQGPEELGAALEGWLAAPEEARRVGELGVGVIRRNQDVIERHIELIRKILAGGAEDGAS